MAIWYCDNINGNDTTGDGSIGAPYKTINKAMTVGANDDEIRVAGSTFTALSGTVTATTNSSTTWNTSVNQTGILNPGDIITVDDAEFGNQKFFYKVFSVSATSIVVDGAWNRTPNVNLNFSRIPVASQQYYTTTASQTFENINIAGKTQFIIRGGWTNSFTAQDGWTIMNYHSSASATAQSGVGFSNVSGAPAGTGMYIDRFMLSHLTTTFQISQRWTPGTLAFVYLTTSNIYTSIVSINTTYPNRDLYLSNSRWPSGSSSLALANGDIGNQWVNCWYANTVNNNATTTVPLKITNVYSRSTGTGITNAGAIQSYNAIVNNLTVATQQTAGTTTESFAIFSPNGPNNNILNGSITVLGPNASSIKALTGSTSSGFIQLILPTQIIENIAGVTATTTSLISTSATIGTSMRPQIVYDQEGEKLLYGQGQIVFADSSQFDTGTNSLRVSNTFPVSGTISLTPINSYFNSTSAAKTITIRAKASAATSATFSIISNGYNTNGQSTAFQNMSETKSLTTSWADYTYTGLDATNAALLLNEYLSIGVRVDNTSAKYIWIDSITIS